MNSNGLGRIPLTEWDEEYRTPYKKYRLRVSPYVCNKFGIAEFLATYIRKEQLEGVEYIFDVGCGVGPLSFFFRDMLVNCKVEAFDINPEAVRCFQINLDRYGKNNITVHEGNFAQKIKKLSNHTVDLIVSNPPLTNTCVSNYKKDNTTQFKQIQLAKFYTNDWHDEKYDLTDYLLLAGRKILTASGKVIIACCDIDGDVYTFINKKVNVWKYAITDYIEGEITALSVGARKTYRDNLKAYIICLRPLFRA